MASSNRMKIIISLMIAITLTSGYLINHWINYGFCNSIRNGIGAISLLFLAMAIIGEALIGSNSIELDLIPPNSMELKNKTLVELFEEKWSRRD